MCWLKKIKMYFFLLKINKISHLKICILNKIMKNVRNMLTINV